MKILVCETIPQKAELPDGKYACMYGDRSSWGLLIVQILGGEVTERISGEVSSRNVRENIRRCFSQAIEAEVETLMLWTSSFVEVHETLETFTNCAIEVEAVDRLEFPLDLSLQ